MVPEPVVVASTEATRSVLVRMMPDPLVEYVAATATFPPMVRLPREVILDTIPETYLLAVVGCQGFSQNQEGPKNMNPGTRI